jgi:hypothetical protein
MFQIRKWKGIVVHAMTDSGMADGLLVAPEKQRQKPEQPTPISANSV